MNNIDHYKMNFGPQHPAAHGVMRLVLDLDGEVIKKIDAHAGLLHRSIEKICENNLYTQNVGYMDRLDYVSMMCQEHGYCLAIEKLHNIKVINSGVKFIRILFDELTRVLNHLLAIACHALDIGSMSAIFWAFEERERIMEFYERVSGARMHAAFNRPAPYFNFNICKNLIVDILTFIKGCFITLNEMHTVLTSNKM